MIGPRLRRWVFALAALDVALLALALAPSGGRKPPPIRSTQQIRAQLIEVLDRNGLRSSLDSLESEAARDSAVLRDGHQLAHALGRRALERANGDSTILAQCLPIFASGCYHGVIEASLHRSHTGMAELERMCALAGSEDIPAPVYECVHGVGHGLLGASGNLRESLRECDRAPEPRFAASCREGTFMEAINTAVAPHQHHHMSEQHGPSGSHDVLAIDPSDPFAPCDRFGGAYAQSCWLFQGFLILRAHRFDAASTLGTCDRAPADWVQRCYESVGLQLAGIFQRDNTWIIRECAQGQPRLAPACGAGAIIALTAMDWSGGRTMAFCGATPNDWKAQCYRAAGSLLAVYTSPRRRAEACGGLPVRFTDACRLGAGLAR
jgi:hypothetical protein